MLAALSVVLLVVVFEAPVVGVFCLPPPEPVGLMSGDKRNYIITFDKYYHVCTYRYIYRQEQTCLGIWHN